MLTKQHGPLATRCGRLFTVALWSGSALCVALATSVFGAPPQEGSGTAGPRPPAAKAAEPKSKASLENVVVHCEVWNVVDPVLLKQVESAAEKDPMKASAVRDQLMEAEDGAHRLARLLAPTPLGRESLFKDEGGAKADNGPSTETGTTLNVLCKPLENGQFDTLFRVKIVGMFGTRMSGGSSFAEPREVQFDFSHAADSAVFRMYQGSSSQPGTVIVFFKVTK